MKVDVSARPSPQHSHCQISHPFTLNRNAWGLFLSQAMHIRLVIVVPKSRSRSLSLSHHPVRSPEHRAGIGTRLYATLVANVRFWPLADIAKPPLTALKRTWVGVVAMSTSLIGPFGSSAFRLSTGRCRSRSRARASLRNRHQGPSISDGWSKWTYDLTLIHRPARDIVPRAVELESYLMLCGQRSKVRIKDKYHPFGQK